jgi:hypothetical protein
MSAHQYFSTARQYLYRWGTRLAVCGGLSAIAFSSAVPTRAQEPIPPAPDQPLIVPMPETVLTEEDVEVTLKGPLHEAFARTVTLDPVPGPRVDRQPPDPIDEIPPEVQPEGENVIWIPGYWSWDDSQNDFLWISGLWRDMPPGRRWVPGYWAQDGAAWQWYSGFWVDAEQESVNYLPQPPESLDLGPTSPAPSDNYFWIPGCWEYNGIAYGWRPGYWAPFVNDWVWVPSSYYGTPRGYVYCGGYWDYRLSNRGSIFASLRFRRYGHYSYRPSYVLNPGSLLLHLFVDSRTGFYLYGDWYGYGAATPWYIGGSRRYYDPILTYNRWTYGSGYTTRLAGWNTWFHSHPDHRPRHTIRDQDAFVSRHHNQSWVNQAVLGTSLSRAMSDGARDGHHFQRVDESSRRRTTEWSRGITQLRTDRERNEGGHGHAKGSFASGLAAAGDRARNFSGRGQGTEDHGRSELKLPKLSAEQRGHSSRGISGLPHFGDRSRGSSSFRPDGGSGSFSSRFGNPGDRSPSTGSGSNPSSVRPSIETRRPDSFSRPSGSSIVQPEVRSGDRNRGSGSPPPSRSSGFDNQPRPSFQGNSRPSWGQPSGGKAGSFSGPRPGGNSGPSPSSRGGRGGSSSASQSSSSGSKGGSISSALNSLRSGGNSPSVSRSGSSGERPGSISSGKPSFQKGPAPSGASSASRSSSSRSSGGSSSRPTIVSPPKSSFSKGTSSGSSSRSSSGKSSSASSSRPSGGSFSKALNQAASRSQPSSSSRSSSSGSSRSSGGKTTPKSGFSKGRK